MLRIGSRKRRAFGQWFCGAVSVVALSCGCDKVDSVIDQAKQEVANQTSSTPAPTAPAAAPVGQPATNAAPAAVAPAPVVPMATPAELLTEFRAIKATEITDAALEKIAAVPDAAAQIVELDLTDNVKLTANASQQLTKLPSLQKLSLAGVQQVSSEVVNAIAGLSQIKDLDLSRTQIGDESVPGLTKASSLQRLQLGSTRVTTATVTQLAALNQLVDLDLSQTAVDDSAIEALKGLPLRRLDIWSTRITNASIQSLSGMETLEYLNIAKTSVNGAAFAKVNWPNITFLGLDSINMGVEGLQSLRKFKQLEELRLYSCGVTFDNGQIADRRLADVFKSMAKLKRLSLNSNQLSDVGVAGLVAGHRTLEELQLSKIVRLTDQGLAQLAKCPKLTKLDISGTPGMTAQGPAFLKSKLPNLVVVQDGQRF